MVLVVGCFVFLVRDAAGQTFHWDPPPALTEPGASPEQESTAPPPLLSEKKTPKKVDKDKLRELARVPRATSHFEFTFAEDDPESEAKEKENQIKRIGELEKAMQGDASDAERYLKLASLYEDESKQAQARAKAAELLLKRVETEPENAKLHWQYSGLLQADDPEAEKHAQEAIRLSPGTWRYWINLGATYAWQFYAPLAAINQPGSVTGNNPALKFNGLLPRKFVSCFEMPERQKTKEENSEEKEDKPSGSGVELSPQRIEEMKRNFRKPGSATTRPVNWLRMNRKFTNSELVFKLFVVGTMSC
jgi:tetratricopeptide (TPR) repeat protein